MKPETFDSEQHGQNWLRSLELYVFPVFGSKTVNLIDAAGVLRAIGPIWNEVPDTAEKNTTARQSDFDYCQVSGCKRIAPIGLSTNADPAGSSDAGVAASHGDRFQQIKTAGLPSGISKLPG